MVDIQEKSLIQNAGVHYTGVNYFLDKKAGAGGDLIVPPAEKTHENLRTEGWR